MPPKKRAQHKINRKVQIISAAEELLTQSGLASVTTRAIADAVACSEGAIYVHFESRIQLLLTVLEQALPDMLIPLHALEEKIGKGTPQGNLAAAMRGLRKFHDRVAPMICSLFAEADLLKGFRENLASRGKGPQGGLARIVRYIREEQKIGRVAEDVDAEPAAATMMSVSFFQAFTNALLGNPVPALTSARIVSSALRKDPSRK
jgi:AcrR family transcriptional regulator